MKNYVIAFLYTVFLFAESLIYPWVADYYFSILPTREGSFGGASVMSGVLMMIIGLFQLFMLIVLWRKALLNINKSLSEDIKNWG